jgi:hypothetical protein
VNHAASFTLQEQVNGGSWSLAYSGSGTSKAYAGKGTGSYGYRVQGCSPGGCGPWSATATESVATPPAVPGDVRITLQGTRVITEYVMWDAVGTATSYQVAVDGAGTPAYTGTATSYLLGSATVPNLPPSHAAKVRACNASGCSAWVQASGG